MAKNLNRMTRAGGVSVLLASLAACSSSEEGQAVIISEIMYHPVLEAGPVDEHEFVELHNRSSEKVSLGGWKLGGDVAYTFPASASLEPGAYVVVAKNKASLAKAYGLAAAAVLGNYDKELDNGKGKVTLADASGKVVEAIAYESGQPWPVAADAMGVEREWLPAGLAPLEKHQGKGQSLERLSLDHGGNDPANWEASAVDGATPGKRNGRAGTAPALIATAHQVGPKGGGAGDLIFPADKVLLRVGLSDPTATDVKVKYFVEDFEKTGEMPKDVAATGTSGWYDFTLDAQKENSVVRYQVVTTKGGKETIISPRASDPFRWHSYFVNPPLRSESRQYHLFINTGDWDTLWTRAMDGHVKGCNTTEACLPTQCEKSEIYDQRVPATFVHDGKVYDVYARYQGSRYGRKIGPFMAEWPYPKPANPAPFRALSWSLKFPRHARFDGKDVASVSKARDNICWAVDSFFGTRLAKLAGIPSLGSRMVRFNVNGGYYHYMREWEENEEQLVTKIEPKGAPRGELYEAKGFSVDEGPWTISDFRPVTGEHCGYSALRRYQETYEIKTNKWKGHDQLMALMDGLEAARATKSAATVKKFLQDNFEWDQLLSYMAFQNWAAAWDDTYHNFALYRRPSSGKWMVLPWDFDNIVGSASWTPKATASPYLGMQADKDSAIAKESIIKDKDGFPTWSRLKDAVFRYARPEYNAAMMKFINTVATQQNVDQIVDELPKHFNLKDAMESPAWAGRNSQRCDLAARLATMKQWAKDRNAAVPGMLTNE